MDFAILVALGLAVIAGLVAGWFFGTRATTPLRKELQNARDEREASRAAAEEWRSKFSEAIANLAAERKTAERVEAAEAALGQERQRAAELAARIAAFERGEQERQRAHEAQLAQLKEIESKLETRFGDLAEKAVEGAHDKFLKRAEEKFGHAGKENEEKIKALLEPVATTLKRYEDGLKEVEKERVDHYAGLREAVEQVRLGQAEVRSEAARLANALRAAPKTRGRWGEQQFKNLIEISGLSSFVDFQEEVSVEGEDGRLRPDFLIRLPGDQQLVVDVKCSLEAYMRAADCADAEERRIYLDDHCRALRTHVEALSRKSYWEQFPKAPDFVIMYIPGDNFISAALETDLELWERAAKKRVIICGPSTFLPMARTVAGIWRQERLAEEAQKVGVLGKEMYDRLAVAAEKLKTVGSGLNTAVRNYNEFVSSFESRVLVTGRRFKELNVDVGAREIREVEPVDALPRHADSAAPLLIDAESLSVRGSGS
ncbi:DNA recombination protein RmuC [Sphingosinicella terrae]|uniref:DNA recombination protein RmuC n=1 Tax=Sphingosinicella terrae TaxID=2172047 RepID=UPI000E0DE8F4|nr:DNA recombination protein RmuC [Sphingosinicella terrae]